MKCLKVVKVGLPRCLSNTFFVKGEEIRKFVKSEILSKFDLLEDLSADTNL